MKNRILSISLAVMLALSVGLVGCAGEEVREVAKYSLAISSTDGGCVSEPGEATSTYDEGAVFNLVADPEEGYRFVNWTGDVNSIADVNAASTTIIMQGNYSIVACFEEQEPDPLQLRIEPHRFIKRQSSQYCLRPNMTITTSTRYRPAGVSW